MALSRIRKSTVLKGRGFAYAGLTLSYIAMLLLIGGAALVVSVWCWRMRGGGTLF
jgi:hypothetical protein